MNNNKILILESNHHFLDTLIKRLTLRNFNPIPLNSLSELPLLLKKHNCCLLLVDTIFLRYSNYLSLLEKTLRENSNLKLAFLEGENKENLPQNFMNFPTFPKEDLREFWEYLRNFQPIEIEEKIQEKNFPDSRIPWIIGETPEIQRLKKNLNKIAILDCPVLILGETGTGKELIAKTIHRLSFRHKEKFIAIHCSTFNPEILYREIFGEEHQYNKNIRKRKGLIETVNGGTLFLHEIEESPLMIQSMLLKFIEHKTFIPYGGSEELKSDVRIIAATNKSLLEKIKQGKFREDLYYRLNAVSLEIPNLKERKDDIPLLAYYFLNKYSKEFKKNVSRISSRALNKLKEYDFPGNVRELEYLIERAVILSEGSEIDVIHFPSRLEKLNSSLTIDKFKPLAEIEKEYILKVLEYTQGNKIEAAKILGISRTSLWRKLKIYQEEDS